MVEKSESFGINGQSDKSLKINEAKPLQLFFQPFFVGRLEAIVLSNQEPLVFILVFENDVSAMNVYNGPSVALILDEAEIETVLSVINDLAELSIRIFKIHTS
jgi:hypothetical protein